MDNASTVANLHFNNVNTLSHKQQMFVLIYSENVVPNSLMNLFQLKYMLQMGPIPNKSLP